MHHFIAVPLEDIMYTLGTIDFEYFARNECQSHFEFLLRYMIIIKKATLSDISLLFHSTAINLSVKHLVFDRKRKNKHFFQFFIDFIFTTLKGGQSIYI